MDTDTAITTGYNRTEWLNGLVRLVSEGKWATLTGYNGTQRLVGLERTGGKKGNSGKGGLMDGGLWIELVILGREAESTGYNASKRVKKKKG